MGINQPEQTNLNQFQNSARKQYIQLFCAKHRISIGSSTREAQGTILQRERIRFPSPALLTIIVTLCHIWFFIYTSKCNVRTREWQVRSGAPCPAYVPDYRRA